MNVQEFRTKWASVSPHVSERAAAQEHFGDLCRVFQAPTPNASASPDYSFEQVVGKLTGGRGFADVWRRGWWAWEYKRPGEDLDRAYQQLKLYADALENPPLLITCDLTRFQVRTNFTSTAVTRHDLDLDSLVEPLGYDLMRDVFTEPLRLRPGLTKEEVTLEAAARFGSLAAGLERRGESPDVVAHALMQMLFTLFAEDVGILRGGLFTQLLESGRRRPESFAPRCSALFEAMRGGGTFGVDDVPHVNGGLFARVAVPALNSGEVAALAEVATLDWGALEPAVFGTLFERSLEPGKRSQLGAHYTGFEDIERVVEPVVIAPLRRRWDDVRAEADLAANRWGAGKPNGRKAFAALLEGFRGELASVRTLDPACGSGNFLYVTLAKLLNLEQAVSAYGAAHGLPFAFPTVRASQVIGLELNATARELAQVAVWIGYTQWMLEHGYGWAEPVLEPLETIRQQDALIDRSGPGEPTPTEWPDADFIVGNPPFLGGYRLRRELGDEYALDLWSVFGQRLPATSNLAAYFFERAREQIANGRAKRAGLLATSSIRHGESRTVLERIKESGSIFLAWSDEPWTLEGASLRISIVGFDNGTETTRTLNGQPVNSINVDLTSTLDVTNASELQENRGIAFMGTSKKGPFDVPGDKARTWLALPSNPNGRPNSDVVRPWFNARGVTERWRDTWIIDFGAGMSLSDAALYEAPFEYVRHHVLPIRAENNRPAYRDRWWLHAEPRPALRRALAGAPRFLVTPIVSKHRVFRWLLAESVPDQKLIAFARSDNYFFGVLSSRAHEVWSLRVGSRHGGERPVYNVAVCFEAYPLPWSPGTEPTASPAFDALSNVARTLDGLRSLYLDPPDATPEQLAKRTLTGLYNARPSWLADAHASLDRAVWAAYGWADDPTQTTDEEILERLLELNRERAG